MRTVAWLLVVVAIGAIARAEPGAGTGTVVVSCNESDASLLVDGVLLPERTPAVLTLPAGTHVIEARKPPLIAQKKTIEVVDQQQVKVRFELLPGTPASPPETGSNAPLGSGSSVPPATGSAAPPAAGSGAPPAGSGTSAAGSGSPAAPLQAPPPAVKPPRCTEGGREVPCAQGPRCTEGGKPVPCKKGDPLPVPPPTTTTTANAAGSGAAGTGSAGSPAAGTGSAGSPAAGTGSAGSPAAGTGSGAHAEMPPVAPGAAAIEIATTAPHAVAYVDGAPVHDAPCVLALEPGEHVVAVYAAGMLPAETVVRADAAHRQRVELTPKTPRRRIDVPAQ